MTEQRPADGSKYTSHACEDEILAAAEIEACRRVLRRALAAPMLPCHALLDVGCGSSGAGVEIAGRAKYVGIDADKDCLPLERQFAGVTYHPEALESTDDWPGGRFAVVLSKRMLCQVPEEDHREAVRRMWRLVRPDGALVLCEPWAEARAALNAARVSWGLRALPEPASGGHPIALEEACAATGALPFVQEAVAPAYVVWTRLLSEVVTGRLPGYREGWPRRPPFAIDPGYLRLGFYRAIAWLKHK